VFAILAKNNIIMRTQIKILFITLFFSGLINAQVTQISTALYLHPWELVSTGDVLYFNAYDGLGSRLYSYDGTNVTQVVIPGNIDPNPTELTPYGNDLYFVVSAGMSNSNKQLWKYSYTTNTVEQIIYSTYTFGLGTQELYVLGNNLFFDGRDNNGDSQLWKYDGVNSIVIPLNVYASLYTEPCNMTAVGNTLFLNANGEQLWKYDGNVAEQIPGYDAEELTPHGSDLFFSSVWGSKKLYKYDGNIVLEIPISTPPSPDPKEMLSIGNDLFFNAKDDVGYKQLWKYDGNVVSQLTVGSFLSPDPRNLTAVGGDLYFKADDGNNNSQLWRYDGNIVTQISLSSDFSSPSPKDLISKGNELWFVARNSNYETYIFKCNGVVCSQMTDATTADVSPSDLLVMNNDIYYKASGTGAEDLFKFNSGVSTVHEVSVDNINVFPNPFNNGFNFSFSTEQTQDVKFRVLNALGEVLWLSDLSDFKGEYTKQINLNENAKGMYFLEIETDDGVVSKKLILQ
tara:strand:+ start:526 stop:2061 length:1536 start_codon:yes stop_codon:yes gene_type:complete